MKRYIFLLSLILIGSCSYAQKASKDLALSIALNAINADNSSSSSGVQKIAARATDSQITELSLTGKSSLYKVCSSGQTVFMNTNTNMPAIIAYIADDVVDMNDLPPAFLDYLAFYEEVAANNEVIKQYSSEWTTQSVSGGVQRNRIVSMPTIPTNDFEFVKEYRENPWKFEGDGSSVWVNPPLLEYTGGLGEINWRQGYPYNKYCPNGSRAGCDAVAMAQVMRYWQWPPGYVLNNLDVPDISSTPLFMYDWDNMPVEIDNKTDERSVNLIAAFLRHCGECIKMKYGADASTSDLEYIPRAMQSAFGYSRAEWVRCHNTKGSQSKNDQRIYENLIAGRPVIARGTNTRLGKGGHAFVIDGITPIGYPVPKEFFHINWGWGVQHKESSNIWCTIDDFYTGTGESYNYWNAFLFDLYPSWMASNSPIVQSGKLGEFFGTYYLTNRKQISLKNCSIVGGSHGYIVSGESVYLGSGCHIAAGSEVYIGTREMVDPRSRATYRSPQRLRKNTQASEYPESDTVLYTSVDEPVFMVKKDEPTTQFSAGLLSQSVRKVREAGQIFVIKESKKYDMKGVLVGRE